MTKLVLLLSLAALLSPSIAIRPTYERNTGKKWSVAQLGEYDEAIKKYHYLAKEKFEGVYVKALSYSVLRKNKDGEDVKALVFKRILEIDSMPALTMK